MLDENEDIVKNEIGQEEVNVCVCVWVWVGGGAKGKRLMCQRKWAQTEIS